MVGLTYSDLVQLYKLATKEHKDHKGEFVT